ncbi:glycoside hydrolase [Halteromyces radiatus]|uniref:glycoside hydrolase n=1 Tax=Halteromyces radiatus TaxID=101107 RepID=UPI002221017C|nr:glycoside hydrolase [Halteromyces radiatus]KAI8099109.1 glycoside hydrolase [Halteromyces radiatus]
MKRLPWIIALCFTTMTVAAPNRKLNATTPTLSNAQKAERIKDAFLFAYHGYEKTAFGHDESRPVSGGSSDSRNGWGASIFDALDTLHIMGLAEEYYRALDHVTSVKWTHSEDLSKTFETNIRYLGGLLSAYDLNPDKRLLNQAIKLTEEVILPTFDTDNGMPAQYVNVNTGQPAPGNQIILAEFGSLQLELVRLSQLTGNQSYGDYGLSIIEKLSEVEPTLPGLYPMLWDLDPFEPASQYITISGGADSYYEYLLKTHILMDGKERLQLDMWEAAVESMQSGLRSRTANGQVFLGEIHEDLKLLQTGELICFLPGNILMGARYLNKPEYEAFATELMEGCYHAWETIPSGLAPESWSWVDESQDLSHFPQNMQLSMKAHGLVPQDLTYDLRPETLESLFYFYRITGDPSYQDKAWNIFQSIEKYCKVKYGYSRVNDVMVSDPATVKYADFQESYIFAETFKYLYLTFSDPRLISLDDYVFNTEAHPFKLSSPIRIQKAF